jgi:hypothetical protein
MQYDPQNNSRKFHHNRAIGFSKWTNTAVTTLWTAHGTIAQDGISNFRNFQNTQLYGIKRYETKLQSSMAPE